MDKKDAKREENAERKNAEKKDTEKKDAGDIEKADIKKAEKGKAGGEKQKKAPKRKPKYGLFSCVGYIYRYIWKYERNVAWTAILTIPVSLAVSALGIYVPSLTIRALEESEVFSMTALIIIGLALADLTASILDKLVGIAAGNAEHFMVMRMIYDMHTYLRSRDYYLDFDPKVQESDRRGMRAVGDNHTAGVHFPIDFAEMVSTVLRFFLFGAVISMLSPWIVLLLILGCIINFFMAKWEQDAWYKTRDDRGRLDKKIDYLVYNLSRNLKNGKDIRLYNLKDYISGLAEKLVGQRKAEEEKLEGRSFLTSLVGFLVVLVRDGLSYLFLIDRALAGQVDAAAFALYFSAITSMSDFIGRLLNYVTKIRESALEVSDFRETFDVEGRLNRGQGIPVPRSAFSIEFKNVSYRYPKGEKQVLKSVSFRIEAGEKIALVGLNGAGKTTLTGLMCGLMLPDEGEVLLDGHSILEYNRDELYSVFGLVPQKYSLMPVSIGENITCAAEGEKVDAERLSCCIETAGLSQKLASLPQGLGTPLNREVHPDGIELSGGEAQKLLLARAMYRNPLCLILDEPTAALDPIAEDRMYQKYGEITENATAVFISHRLASTRFCDRIFLLDGAVIAEEGSHEELMAKGGKYRELFDVQSRYYKEGASENE